MSVSMAVILESGPVPEDVVPPDQRSFGQNVVRYFLLESVAVELGVPPLDHFVVDWCGRVEEALREANWQEPDPPAEWGDAIPINGPPVTDPAYLAAQAEYERIVEQVYRELPWYDPAEGLVTVRALIAALDSNPSLNEKCYGAVWDLRAFRYELEYAERIGTRFHFGVSY